MKGGRLTRLRCSMRRERLDAMLTTSAVSVSYLSGAADSLWALVSRSSSWIMPSRLSDYSVRTAARPPWRVLDWRDPNKDLLRIMSAQRICRLGIEAGTMSVAHHDALRRRLGGAVLLVKCSGLVEGLRQVKDDDELKAMNSAGAITAEIAGQLPYIIRPGRTERAVAAEIDRRMILQGADGPAFDTIVLAGARTAHPHGRPGERRFKRGDLCLVDFGARLNGYRSDATRVFCVPPAAELMQRRYSLVLRAYAAAEALARAGARCEGLDRASRQSLGALKSRFIHGLGHGVGLEIHEGPRVAAGEKQRLTTSNVVTIEPGIYFPGWGAIRLENTLLITSSGARSLTGDIPPELPAAGQTT